MVGFCGVFGNPEHSIEDMSQKLFYNGDEESHHYRDKNLEVEIVQFSKTSEDQPVEDKHENLFWIWGNIYGYEHKGEYFKKEDEVSNTEYISSLHDEYGDEVFGKLNGEFAAVKYDIENETISLITDKLSTHPIFFTKTETGNLVFSTNIQSIPLYPEVETTFDLKYLAQFFTFERVLGTKTVMTGIEQLHPGSILSYNLDCDEIKNEVYWTPKYKPNNRPFSKIVQEFTNLFREIIDERIDEERTYGLYLSGGSDSRLVLAMINELYPELDLICYHLNEHMNREARIAKKVAESCGYEFELLKRDEEYQKKVLEETSSISIFSSFFDHSHFVGFRDKVSEGVDEVIHGNYSDTILGRHHLPKNGFNLPLLNEKLYLPSFHRIQSFGEFIEFFTKGYGSFCRDGNIPSFLEGIDEKFIKKSLDTELTKTKNSVLSHGIYYDTFDDFIHWWSFYPLTNTKSYLVYYTEIQSYDSFTPFLDNRIINFTLSLPDQIVSKKDIINSTLTNLNPSLANIPHAGSNISIKYPKIIHFLKSEYEMAKCKLFPNQKWDGPWGNTAEIIRESDFVKTKINEKKNLIHKCEFLNFDQIKSSYIEHMNDKDNTNQLFALLTFIENPATQYIYENQKVR